MRVVVMGVDLARNRIALTMKSKPSATPAPTRDGGGAARASGGGERRSGAPSGRRAPRAEPPRTHKPGDVAPNGMRFK